MAQRYKFFNSTSTDSRTYQAQDFADYFGSVLSTGLLHTDEVPGMKVEVEPGTLNTIVSPGKAIMRGHLYENTTPHTLTHSIPEPTLDRIDRIVLRLDLRNSERNILLHVKEGVSAADPVPPELQRDNFIHEISLAQIFVRANTVQLLPSDLIDERLDEELCGLVYSLISVPTDLFLDKLQQMDDEWKTWFDDIQGALPNEAKLVSIEDVDGNFISNNVEGALKETIEKVNEVPKKIEQSNFKIIKTNKDSEGVFTTVEYKRNNNTTAIRSVLSGGTSPQYTTRTITFYDSDGVTVLDEKIYSLSYDSDGDLVGEE